MTEETKTTNSTPENAVPETAEVKEIAVGDIPNSTIQEGTQKKEGFFEKGIKNLVKFTAKKTGNPDPESGSIEGASENKKDDQGFFNKLVSGTKNLLSHAENITETAVSKTKEVTKKIIDLPGKVVGTTAETLQKGVDKGNELKEKIEGKSEEISQKLGTHKDNLKESIKTGVDKTLDTTEKLGTGVIQ